MNSCVQLRVLFVIPGDGRDSSMIFVRRQAESLLGEGLEVDCFYLRSRTSPTILIRDFRRLKARIRSFGPSLIHAHFGTVTAAVAALAAGRLPLIVTYRGGDLNGSPSARKLRSFLGRLLSQISALRAAHIICVSRALRDRLWWRRDRVSVLPSGVDTELFCREPRSSARARLGWALEEPVVLFNAGFDPRNKRLDLAQKAAEVARAINPSLRLEVLNGQVAPERVPLLMNASDCLLITSDSEGSPTVLQEALACGLPVVSVPVGDALERLQGIMHTRIVPRQAVEIARALAEITAEPLRTDAPEVIERLSLRHIARQMCMVYRNVLRSSLHN